MSLLISFKNFYTLHCKSDIQGIGAYSVPAKAFPLTWDLDYTSWRFSEQPMLWHHELNIPRKS